MRKRTKVAILTFTCIFWKSFAEFCFISIGMIQLLNFIMRIYTILLTIFIVYAFDMVIFLEVRASSIIIIMIIYANFPLMRVYFLYINTFSIAGSSFKRLQIKSKKFMILKMKFIINMHSRANKSIFTIVKINTLLSFIKQWMIYFFILVLTFFFVLKILCVLLFIYKRIISKICFYVRISSFLYLSMPIRAKINIMILFYGT